MKIKGRLSKRSRKLAVSVFIVFLMILSLLAFNTGSNAATVSNHVAKSGTSFSETRHAGMPASLPINPYELYPSEPAPMGLADFGLGPGNAPYTYNTTSFLGIIKIGSISVMDNTSNSSSLSFQLNLNLVFNNSGNTYVYWVQDVAFLNTTTQAISVIDNIWNMSSGSAQMHNSTVSGAGTVANASGAYFYYDVANSTLPGASANIPYPSVIKLKVNSMLNSHGVPEISFQYQDGYGWETYDSVNFTFAHSVLSDSGFVVNGYNYEPNKYSFYDAEIILGGPGGGSSTKDLQSNMSLLLQYWNGNNYQEISNAFNFGSDTAESINNVVSGAYHYISNGSLFEKINTGPGSLSQVYDSGTVSSLEIKAPIGGGNIFINGTSTSFTGDRVNLTLAPGNYSVELFKNGALYYRTNITLTGGQKLILPVNEYLVAFKETGLPIGTAWWVNLTQGSYTSNTENIDFYISNGSYQFHISGQNHEFFPNITQGTFTVHGTDVTLLIGFSHFFYNVTFREYSLPSGSKWSVLLNGSTYISSNSSITIQVADGTYNFLMENLTDYYTLNYSYTLTVNGKNLTADVLYYEYGNISGTVFPSGASLTVNGNSVPVTNGKFLISAIAGNYSIEVTSPGYKAYYSNLTLTYGQNASLNINLTKISVPASKLPGYEALGAMVGILAVVGIGAVIARRR